MTRIKIFDTPSFTLTSWENGTSFALFNKATKESVYVQGDDAGTFWDEFEGYQLHRPDWSIEDTLAELWSEYALVAEMEYA